MKKFLGIVLFAFFISLSLTPAVTGNELNNQTKVTIIKEFSEKGLRQEMWVWASLEEELNAAQSGWVPVVPPVDAENAIDLAIKNINTYISLINNEKHLNQAEKLAEDFIKIEGTNEIVGKYVKRLLEVKKAFLIANEML
ncbi:MAG: hypothetical protein ACOX2I_06950 [Candidatus Ozemobacteraceae bacterium]|jgi:hypothetical protein|nr:hypothetical protein [Candidatus Riflebacteria bacterium]